MRWSDPEYILYIFETSNEVGCCLRLLAWRFFFVSRQSVGRSILTLWCLPVPSHGNLLTKTGEVCTFVCQLSARIPIHVWSFTLCLDRSDETCDSNVYCSLGVSVCRQTDAIETTVNSHTLGCTCLSAWLMMHQPQRAAWIVRHLPTVSALLLQWLVWVRIWNSVTYWRQLRRREDVFFLFLFLPKFPKSH